jgi:hypothetical protein
MDGSRSDVRPEQVRRDGRVSAGRKVAHDYRGTSCRAKVRLILTALP